MLGNNAIFVTIVLDNLQNPESPAMHSLCIQTVGFIGQTIEGKMALEKLGKSRARSRNRVAYIGLPISKRLVCNILKLIWFDV